MLFRSDRALLEPQAMRFYADGFALSDIAAQLDVSVTSLSRWKEESRRPGADMDEWDRGRAQKRSNIQRLRDLFEDQLFYLEGLNAEKQEAVMKILNDNLKAYRGELGCKVAKQLCIVPEIVFYLDTTLNYAEHIDELLKK